MGNNIGSNNCAVQPDGTYKDIIGFNFLDAECTHRQCNLRSDGTYEWTSWENSRYSDSGCQVPICSLQDDGTYKNFLGSVCNNTIGTPTTTTTTPTTVNVPTTTTTIAPSGTLIITTTTPPDSSSSSSASTTTTSTAPRSFAPVVLPGRDDTTTTNNGGIRTGNGSTDDGLTTTVAPTAFMGMTVNQMTALYVILGLIVLTVLFFIVKRIFAPKADVATLKAPAPVPVSSVAVPIVEAANTTTSTA